MSVIKTLAWYGVPRPITDVVVNGIKVRQFFRSNRGQAKKHAEEMFTAIFRVIAAVPFAFLCKIALIHYCQGSFRKWIIIEILTLALGVMMFPSFKMGWSSGVLYISMNVCYYSRSSITRGLWGVAGLISYYGIQSYKSDSLGYLDTKILKLAARAANALCA